MKYIVSVLEEDKFITVWNFKTETVFVGFIFKETAKLKATAKIGMWKLKKLK